MKINSSSDSNKNAFLIFNRNKSPNLPKKNLSKTRTDTKSNLFNFTGNELQEFGFNNTLRSKPNPLNYPTIKTDMSNNNLIIDAEQFNFKSILNQIKSSENDSNSKNINIILYAPNYVVNKMDNGKNHEMDSGHKEDKNEKNTNLNSSNKKNQKGDDFPSNNKKNKKLFDSNFNLLEDECGDDELSQILKEFVNLRLDTPIKKDSVNSNNDDNKKTYTNTGDGDSANYFRCESSGQKGNFKCNIVNPYLKVEYKK